MASLAVQGYSVPLAPTTGGMETMEATVDSLLQLKATCDAIFGSVLKRVDHMRDQYEGLQERVGACSSRVEELKSRKEATLVLSPRNSRRLSAKRRSRIP